MRMRVLILTCVVLLAACGDDSGSSGSAAARRLTAVQLNTLHGATGDCPASDNCRLPDRIDLLFRWIARSGCPDIVTLQEVWSRSAQLIMAHLDSVCPGAYQAVQGAQQFGLDNEMVLTRYPVLAVEQQSLFPGFRHVLWVRIDHPLGPVDVFTTHLASGSDGATVPCDANPPCPSACIDAGAMNRRDCQAVQMAAFIESTHDVDSPAVIAGDFNSDPGSFVYGTFTGRGWSDTYLEAGNPECTPSTGVGCTSGRQDESLADLESRASNETERIDFVFLVPPRNGFPCSVRLDRSATRLFADRPNPFAAPCGPAPAAICWPSDHEGVALDLRCE